MRLGLTQQNVALLDCRAYMYCCKGGRPVFQCDAMQPSLLLCLPLLKQHFHDPSINWVGGQALAGS